MDDSGVSVLLVGSCARKSSSLGRQLLKRGCNLSFATCKKEAIELLQHRPFDLVLSEFMLPDGTAYELMAPCLGTDTTMFFYYAVENSCWWINAMLRGQDRSEEAGMRPKEFVVLLNEILSKKSSTSNAHSAIESRHGASLVADYANRKANQQVETDLRAWDSEKEKHRAKNES
jgi:DNA-binding NtrC family response regulator